MVSTWILTHKSEVIRGCETETMHHDDSTARQYYLLNKVIDFNLPIYAKLPHT